MRSLLIALMVVVSSPAMAANCPYVNSGGDVISFIDDGQNTAILERKGSEETTCSWMITPDGPDAADIACEDGTRAGYFFASDAIDAHNRNLLIFAEDVWYGGC